jgi:hypothetical protein
MVALSTRMTAHIHASGTPNAAPPRRQMRVRIEARRRSPAAPVRWRVMAGIAAKDQAGKEKNGRPPGANPPTAR